MVKEVKYRDVERLGAPSPFRWKTIARPLLGEQLELVSQELSTIDGSLSEVYRHGALFIRERREGSGTWTFTAGFRLCEHPEVWLDMPGGHWQPIPVWFLLATRTPPGVFAPVAQSQWLIGALQQVSDIAQEIGRSSPPPDIRTAEGNSLAWPAPPRQ